MELLNKLNRMMTLLEDATTASLAPYPVTPVGSVVTVTKKKDAKHAEEEKHNSKLV